MATVVTCPHCATKNRIASQPEGVPRCAVCHHPLPWMVEATQASFDEEIRASVPVLVDFWAPWCGPCRMVTPAVERLAEVYAGQLKLVKLNVDEAPEIAARFGVQGIPLLVVIRDGEEIARQVGAAASGPLRSWLESHIGPPKPDTAGEAAGTAPGAAAGPG